MKSKGLLFAMLCMWSGLVFGQAEIHLGGMTFVPQQNMVRLRGSGPELRGELLNGRRSVLVQFSAVPSPAERLSLKARGLELLDYVGGHAYWAMLRGDVAPRTLRSRGSGVRLISVLDKRPEWVMSSALKSGRIPDYARCGGDRVRLSFSHSTGSSLELVRRELEALGATGVELSPDLPLGLAEVPFANLEVLASRPCILALDYAPAPRQRHNIRAGALSRAYFQRTSAALGGRELTGKGVRIGIWDASVHAHSDFGNRLTVMEFEDFDPHGTHVAGTVMGNGLLDPMARGMAPGAEMWSWNFNYSSNGLSVPHEMLHMIQEHGMTLTQNSYGQALFDGVRYYCFLLDEKMYDAEAMNVDYLAWADPELLHVFSAGNDGRVCQEKTTELFGAPRYGTGTNRGKNVLMVGALDARGRMTEFSSWGPTDDGRMYPTVCAMGEEVYSTLPYDRYGEMSGTSMSAPVAAGTLALLSERYSQLYPGPRIAGILLKALAANTARDAGRPHADFQYGYGILDAERALQAIEHEYFKHGTIEHAASQELRIKVPAGALGARIMLGWMDEVVAKEYLHGESILVNDLDLTVMAGGSEFKPWVCDHRKGHVEDLASRTVDSLNTLEQVTLSAQELEGVAELVVKVKGRRIPGSDGRQDYVLTWTFDQEPAPRIVSPGRGDHFSPGGDVLLQVEDLSGEPGQQFYSVEISYDGGATYHRIGQVKNSPLYGHDGVWIPIPKEAKTTTKAMIRIVDADGLVARSEPFVISAPITNLSVTSPTTCGGDLTLSWDRVEDDGLGYAVLLVNPDTEEISTLEKVQEPGFTIVPTKLPNGPRRLYVSVAQVLEGDILGPRAPAIRIPVLQNPPPLAEEGVYFEEFFKQVPPRHVGVEAGQWVEVMYTENFFLTDQPGANALALAVRGDPSGNFSFNTEDFFSQDNAPHRGVLRICNLPQANDTIYLHLSALVEEAVDARFRVLLDGVPLADQLGHTTNEKESGTEPYASGFRDFYYAIEPQIQSAEVRLEFVGQGVEDMLLIGAVRLLEASPKAVLQFDDLELPDHRARMATEPVALVVRNTSSREVLDAELKIWVNDELHHAEVIPKIAPWATRRDTVWIDLSTPLVQGERKDIRAELDYDTGEACRAQGSVYNLGDVIQMPFSPVMCSPFGCAPVDPKTTIEVDGPAIFTDHGGRWLNCPDRQLVTLKLRPADPNMALEVTFTEFNLTDPQGESLLAVWTSDVDLTNSEIRVDPATLRGHLLEPRTFTSRAEDGSIVFRVGTGIGGPEHTGWVANVRLVPRANTLSVISASCELFEPNGTAESMEVPVRIQLMNHWDSPIEVAQAYVYGSETPVLSESSHKLISEVHPGPIPHGAYEWTTQGKINLDLGEAYYLYVKVNAVNDLKAHDNSVKLIRATYDHYCLTDQLIDEGAPNFKSIGATALGDQGRVKIEKALSLDVRKWNQHRLKDALICYQGTGEASLSLKGEKSAGYDEATTAFIYVDWDRANGFNTEDELVRVDFSAGEGEKTFKLNVDGRSGRYRMRIIYTPETTETVGPCISTPTVASMTDVWLEVIEGAVPKPPVDLIALEEVKIGQTAVIPPTASSLPVEMTVKVPFGFQKTIEVKITRSDGTLLLEHTEDHTSSPVFADKITISKSIDVSATGLYDLTVTVSTPDDEDESNNVQHLKLFKPEEKLFSVVMREPESYIDLSLAAKKLEKGTGIPLPVVLEAWLCLEEGHLGRIFTADNLLVAALPEMLEPYPSNALFIQIGAMEAWTPANTLRPGTWHHVVVEMTNINPPLSWSRGSCDLRAFIDGQELSLTRKDPNVDAGPSFENLAVGPNLHARIKGIRLRQDVRSADQIKDEMFELLGTSNTNVREEFVALAGYGATELFSSRTMSLAPIVNVAPEQVQASDNTGLWMEESSLIKGFSIQGATTVEETAPNSFTVWMPAGTELTSVKGEVLSVWTKMPEMTLNSTTFSPTFTVDLSKPLTIKASSQLWGVNLQQEVNLRADFAPSAACELLSLSFGKDQNPDLPRDVAVSIDGLDLVADLGSECAGLSIRAMIPSFEVSPGARILVRGIELKSGESPIDLNQELALEVVAEDGAHRRIYSLRVDRQRTLSFSLGRTTFTYGETAAFGGEILTDSPQEVSYHSEDPDVASFANGMVHAGLPGRTRLFVSQAGGQGWGPAESNHLEVTVDHAPLKLRPAVAKVEVGASMSQDFEYDRLVHPEDYYTLPLDEIISRYDILPSGGTEPVEGNSLRTGAPVDLPVGSYRLRPKHTPGKDYDLETDRYRISLLEKGFQVVAGALVPLRIAVVDPSGDPIPTARIKSGTVEFATKADPEGNLLHRAFLPDGEHALRIEAEGYAPKLVRVFPNVSEFQRTGAPERYRFVLDREELQLRYWTQANGTVNGRKELLLNVARGYDGPEVLAQPQSPYVFEGWSDGRTETWRQDLQVEEAAEFEAVFSLPKYTLSYLAGDGGHVEGENHQIVTHSEDATPVKAVPDPGHYFDVWSDGVETAERQDLNVESSAELVASFPTYATLPFQNDFEENLGLGWRSVSAPDADLRTWIRAKSLDDETLPSHMAVIDTKTLKTDASLLSPKFQVQNLSRDLLLQCKWAVTGYGLMSLKLQYRTNSVDWTTLESTSSTWGDLEDAEATLEASAYAGAEFLQFRLQLTSPGDCLSAQVDDLSIFEKPAEPITIHYLADPEDAATFTVEGSPVTSQEVNEDERFIPRPVTVVPAQGYYFLRWSNGTDSTTYVPNLPVLEEQTLTAILLPNDEHFLRFQVEPQGTGAILANGNPLHEIAVKSGGELSVEAVPEPGFQFLRWNDNGSTQPQRQISNISGAQTFVALFTEAQTELAVSVVSGGKPVADALVQIGAAELRSDQYGRLTCSMPQGEVLISIRETPNHYGYQKVHSIEGQQMQLEVELEAKINQELIFVVKLNAQPLPEASVKVGDHQASTDAQGVARFALIEGSYDYSVSSPGTLPVEGRTDLPHGESRTVHVNLRDFARIQITQPVNGTISIVTTDPTPVEVKDQVKLGTEITIRLEPKAGYKAKGLIVNGVEHPAPYTLTVSEDLTISGELLRDFARIQVTQPVNGTISIVTTGPTPVEVKDQVKLGTEITIRLEPKAGYKAKGLIVNGVEHPAPYTLTVSGDLTISGELSREESPVNPNTQGVESSTPSLTLSPNPVLDILQIKGLEQPCQVVVTSLMGVQLLSRAVGMDGRMDVSMLPSGVYLLRVRGFNLRFVKR